MGMEVPSLGAPLKSMEITRDFMIKSQASQACVGLNSTQVVNYNPGKVGFITGFANI